MADFIPTEVLEMILAPLGLKDLRNCRYVNRDWNLVSCKYLKDLHKPIELEFSNEEKSATRFTEVMKTSSQPFLFSKFELIFRRGEGPRRNECWMTQLATFAENCGEFAKNYTFSEERSKADPSAVTQALESLINISPNIESFEFCEIQHYILSMNITTPLPKLKTITGLPPRYLAGISSVAPNLENIRVTASITRDSDWMSLCQLATLQPSPVLKLHVRHPSTILPVLNEGFRELHLKIESLRISLPPPCPPIGAGYERQLEHVVQETKKCISSLPTIKELDLDYRFWYSLPGSNLENLESITFRGGGRIWQPMPLPMPFCLSPLQYPNLTSIAIDSNGSPSRFFDLRIPFTRVTSLSLGSRPGSMNITEKFPNLKILTLPKAGVDDFRLIFKHTNLTYLNLGLDAEAWRTIFKEPENRWLVVRREELVDLDEFKAPFRAFYEPWMFRKEISVDTYMRDVLNVDSAEEYFWSARVHTENRYLTTVRLHRFALDDGHELVKLYQSLLPN